ncbi:MAG: hypothetical protein IJF69_01355 [Clostridia bacterium]|nr:hypothetical protein [Clostridia bacterium]
MSKICPACKKEFPDGATYCSECGEKLETVPAPEAQPEVQPEVQQVYYQPQPEPQQTQYQPEQQYQYRPQSEQQYQYRPQPYVYQHAEPEKKKKDEEKLYPAVPTAAYFWLNIAMVIPVVGFILSIILTCAPRNRSLKNYAKAYLIGYLICIGISVAGIVASFFIAGGTFELIEEIFWML